MAGVDVSRTRRQPPQAQQAGEQNAHAAQAAQEPDSQRGTPGGGAHQRRAWGEWQRELGLIDHAVHRGRNRRCAWSGLLRLATVLDDAWPPDIHAEPGWKNCREKRRRAGAGDRDGSTQCLSAADLVLSRMTAISAARRITTR